MKEKEKTVVVNNVESQERGRKGSGKGQEDDRKRGRGRKLQKIRKFVNMYCESCLIVLLFLEKQPYET